MTHNRISAVEFRLRTSQDPAWCAKLTEPLEVFGWLDMNGWDITHLSPCLTFTDENGKGGVSFRKCRLKLVAGTFLGTAPDGTAADFGKCEIEKLEGTFHGKLDCFSAQIKEIGKLEVIAPTKDGTTICFENVTGLKTARGKFHGGVSFYNAEIEEIDGDPETGLISVGETDFTSCKQLKVARGRFHGAVDFTKSGIEEIDPDPETGLIITGVPAGTASASFNQCEKLTVLTGNFPTIVTCRSSGIRHVKNFTCKTPEEEVHCTLDSTPILKKDPVGAGQAMFNMRGCSLEALRATALKHHKNWAGCLEIIKGITTAKKIREVLKKGETPLEI